MLISVMLIEKSCIVIKSYCELCSSIPLVNKFLIFSACGVYDFFYHS